MICEICGHQESEEIDFGYFFLPTRSNRPSFHKFKNFICGGCKVVFMYPQPSEKSLVEFYNMAYRTSPFALNLNGQCIDSVVDFDRSIQGFQRFKNFFDIVLANSEKCPEVKPASGDIVMDYGGYQGAFLSAAARAWGCDGILYDYNQKGVEFAKRVFGFERSMVAKDINADEPPEKVRFVSCVHSFEHLRNPKTFLVHLRENVLRPDGYFYLEVPNVFGSHLSDPTHFFMYSELSLKYTLELSGYEVIDIRFTGFPREKLLIGHARENITCIARPAKNPNTPQFPIGDANSMYHELKSSYRTLSRSMLYKSFKFWLRDTAIFCYQSLSVIVLDRLPFERAEQIRRPIKKLKRILSGKN